VVNPEDPETANRDYESVCERCGVTERRLLTARSEGPECGCGSPPSPGAGREDFSAEQDVCGEAFLDLLCEEAPRLGLAAGGSSAGTSVPEPGYRSLDHPHAQSNPAFEAIGQAGPIRHRVWCAVFVSSECDCGYQRR
jgi:hypothetical protein